MKISYRELKRGEELKSRVVPREEIRGLGPCDMTSIITLTAMTMDCPRLAPIIHGLHFTPQSPTRIRCSGLETILNQ
ncbi:MAG: hypothetical protein ABFD97_13110 [Syntrophobacter sp.]